MQLADQIEAFVSVVAREIWRDIEFIKQVEEKRC